MAVIVVSASEAGAGATTIAVGLAHRLAYAGHRVRVERLGGDDRAPGDAVLFASLEFAGSSGAPLEATAIAASGGGGDSVTIAEAAEGSDGLAVARAAGAALLLVRSHGEDAPERGSAVVPTIVNYSDRAGPWRVPEERLLAAPSVGHLIEASGASVLGRSVEGDAALCEHIVVGPIAEDSDEPHFRRFARKAVVTRSEKVDVALAALSTDTRCLILTGGVDPSPYLIDRVAADRNTTLLLVPGDTVQTMRDLERAFGSSPFSGDEKVERIGALMATALDDGAVSALLGGR